MASVVNTVRRWKAPVRWVALAAMVGSLAVHDVQPALHAAAGSFFVVAAGAHLLANSRWIRTVARRTGHGLPRRVAADAVLDAALIVVTAGLAVTGIGALPHAGAPDRIVHVHGHLAIALGLILVAHLVRHRKQLVPRSASSRDHPRPSRRPAGPTVTAGSPSNAYREAPSHDHSEEAAMQILMVFDHPYTMASADSVPHRRGFSAALAAAAIRGATRAGHQVDVIDLAADGFQPAMSMADLVAWRQGRVVDPLVLDYQRRLMLADHLVFVFPVWWEAMPARTKGFLDRVLTKGLTFEELTNARGRPFRNLLPRLDGVTVLSTMATPDTLYRWWFGNPLTKIFFKGTFGKIGVQNLTWVNFARVDKKSSEQRERMLRHTEARFAALRARSG